MIRTLNYQQDAKVLLFIKINSNIAKSFQTDCGYFQNDEIYKIWHDFSMFDIGLLNRKTLLLADS